MAKIHVSFIANACNRATAAAVHFGGRQRRNAWCKHESSFGYSKTKTSGVNSASKFERWAICIFSSRDLMLRAGRVSTVCGGVVVIAHCPSPIILLLLLLAAATAAASTCSVIRKFQKCQSHIDTLFIHNTYLFINGDMFGGLIRGFKITNKVVGFAYYVILFTKLHVGRFFPVLCATHQLLTLITHSLGRGKWLWELANGTAGEFTRIIY